MKDAGSVPAASLARRAGDPASGRLRRGEPLGVYVHFPFCGVRCPYCDFAVDTRAEIPHAAYADAVIAELRARAAWFDGAGPLRSVYFGGGTPGLWRPEEIARVIAAAAATFGAATLGALEITVEVNPGEIGCDRLSAGDRLSALRGAGVNRLSLGVQSLDDRLLAALGRTHGGAAGGEAIAAARAAGFDNVSIDLMFGVPGQTRDDWRRTVDAALAWRPEHVSAYALTVERGTAFGALDRAGRLARPDDEAVATMLEDAAGALAAAGLARYEVSSYAVDGRRSRHNQLYWALAPYLGVGASAASFRPLDDGTGWRFSDPRATDVYLKAAHAGAGSPAPRHVERRAAADLENEAVWLGLRTIDGIDRAAHRARHGADPVAGREAELARATAAGWLAVEDDRVRLTEAGVLFADEIAARLWR